MARFKWRGLSSDGTPIAGYLYARSSKRASMALPSDITIFSLEPTWIQMRRQRWRAILFIRQLVELLKSNLMVSDALQILSEASSDPIIKAIAHDAVYELSMGSSLSNLLIEWKELSYNELIFSIKNGERSGDFISGLEGVCRLFECREGLKKSLMRSLSMPLISLIMALAIIALFITTILPQYQQLINTTGKGGNLPWLMRMGSLIGTQWGFFIGVFVITALGIVGILIYRYLSSRIRMMIPAAWRYDESIFLTQLSLLLKNRVSLAEAISLAAGSTGSSVLKLQGELIGVALMKGEPFASVIEQFMSLTKESRAYLLLGDRAGNILFWTEFAADHAHLSAEAAIRQMGSICTILILLFVALILALFIVTIYQPIIALMQTVS